MFGFSRRTYFLAFSYYAFYVVARWKCECWPDIELGSVLAGIQWLYVSLFKVHLKRDCDFEHLSF